MGGLSRHREHPTHLTSASTVDMWVMKSLSATYVRRMKPKAFSYHNPHTSHLEEWDAEKEVEADVGVSHREGGFTKWGQAGAS